MFLTKAGYVDPWDMLNNAQKSLFIVENDNVFWDILITRSTDITVSRAGSQLKISLVDTALLGAAKKQNRVCSLFSPMCHFQQSKRSTLSTVSE